MLTTLRIVPAQAAEQHTLPRTHSAGTGARVRRASVQPCGQVPMHFSEQSKELAVTVKKTKSNLPGAGPGRPKGIPNKTNGAIKDMILTALSDAGGSDYLLERANDPKTAAAFLGLVGKVLPMTIAGDPANPVQQVVRVELVPMRGSN